MEQLLMEKSLEMFGKVRTAELEADLEKLAADLNDIRGYPLTIEDEL